MGDRIRIGELLAAIGTIGLIVSVVALDWFTVDAAASSQAVGAPAYAALATATLGAGGLGWFAFGSLVVTSLASLVFFVRALTGRGPERAMLQGPVAYVFALFSLLVLLVRLFVFRPGASLEDLALPGQVELTTEAVMLQTGAWVGLLSVPLIVIGLWIAMSDARTGTAAAKARTAELLSRAPVRTVVAAGAAPSPDASVVADDAIPTDPSTPSDPASGGPA